MKKIVIGLSLLVVLSICVYVGVINRDNKISFPVAIEAIKDKIEIEGWEIQALEGYSQDRTHFKLQSNKDIFVALETMGGEKNRFLSAAFFTNDGKSFVEIDAFLKEIGEIIQAVKNIYGVKYDIDGMLANGYNSSLEIKSPALAHHERIGEDIVIFNFKSMYDKYNLARLTIMNINSYEKYIQGQAEVMKNTIGNIEAKDTKYLIDNTPDDKTIFTVNGKLTEMSKVDTEGGIYKNSATLTDNNGNISILLSPNGFTQKELLNERTHYIRYDKALKSYIIIYSVKI